MYEVRCIVGDKKLREVLFFLNNNNTLEPPVVIPVADGRHPDGSPHRTPTVKAGAPPKQPNKKRKKPVQAGGRHLKGRGSTEVIRTFMMQNGVTAISSRQMRDVTVGAGYSPNAYSHAIKILLGDRTIKKTEIQGQYTVARPTQKAEVVTDAQA